MQAKQLQTDWSVNLGDYGVDLLSLFLKKFSHLPLPPPFEIVIGKVLSRSAEGEHRLCDREEHFRGLTWWPITVAETYFLQSHLFVVL